MRKLILLFLLLMGIQMQASFILLEHENSKLISGIWNYFPKSDNRIAVGVQIEIETNGWAIDKEWKMLKFSRTYNGEVTEINPHYLNEDDNPYTHFTVTPNGPNSARISFCDIWFTNSIADVKKSITRYTVTGTKNGKEHHCVIQVNYNDVVTTINDIQIKEDNTIYDLQGNVLATKPRGLYIQNHRLYKGQ